MKTLWMTLALTAAAFAEIQMSDAQIKKMGIVTQEIRMIRSESLGPLIGIIDYSDKGAKNYTLGAEATVVELFKHKGDSVKKGEAICRIASGELLSDLYELNEMRNRYKIAQEYARKDDQLYKDGIISLRESQKSALEAMSLKVKMQEIESRFAFAGADMRTQDGMSFTIRAKQSGIVGDAPLKAGEKIEPFRPYVKLVTTNALNAYIKIPPKLIGSLRIGAAVTDAKGGQIGSIASFSTSVETVNNSGTAVVTLNVSNGNFRPGTSAEFYIASVANERWALLPRSSVTKYKKKDICFIKTAKGFEPKEIEIEKVYKDHVAVDMNGFTPKTRVVNEGIITLKGALSGMGFE